jgi:protein gp37
MNKQKKTRKDGTIGKGIEWTDYTWNPVAGCKHACRWTMPDGTTAICYAEAVAEGVAQAAYKHGFAHHYYHPGKLKEPGRVKVGSRIFMDSMSDLMGHWVPLEEIHAVLNVCEDNPHHSFQLLTKAAPRLLSVNLPKNVWAGVSAPPSEFMGKPLSQAQQERMLHRTLTVLDTLREEQDIPVRWISFEPLSWDVSSIVSEFPSALSWAVIGAASNGKATFQPQKEWVENLLAVLDKQGVPVFFKGNLEWNPWREAFPVAKGQLEMFA